MQENLKILGSVVTLENYLRVCYLSTQGTFGILSPGKRKKFVHISDWIQNKTHN